MNTQTDAPVSGDYDGVDVDGLVWSMQPQGSGAQTFGDGTLYVEVARGDQVLVQRNIERSQVAPNVEKRAIATSEGSLACCTFRKDPDRIR